jgi:Ca2+-binding RTX toxin-like protein
MLWWEDGLALAQESDPVLVGAGDIAACDSDGDEATAELLDGIEGTVFTLGDNVYETGTSSEFANCYHPTWGRHKARTYPAAGNHEYETPGASGYFGYFGAAAGDPAKGYYSYDLGSWHVVVLNSNCSEVGGCEADSPQERWLREDLKAHPVACTAAYFHHSRFSSGISSEDVGPFWEALYDMGADVVISGHSHTYERFAAQDPNGRADTAQGIRQFVVGTGGRSLHSFKDVEANSVVRINDAYGVLKLTLHVGGYDWEFVPVSGATRSSDSGSDQCHDPEPDEVAPTITGVVPGADATGANVRVNVEGVFSERMDPSTFTGSTFALLKEGTGAPVSAAVTYDWAAKKAVLNPAADLDHGATYTATVKGGSEGVKDLAGNPLAADKVWSFATTSIAACTLTGTSSAETLTGTSGDDVICAGGGGDTIRGLGGNDTIKGDAGNDKLFGGPGDDTLDGGTGTNDTTNFSGSLAAITASLTTNTATGEGSDTLAGVESLVGSPKNDVLTGSEANNTLSGGGGADALDGLGGADKLTGGGGNDTEHGGMGNDSVVGSGGADNLFGDENDDALNSKDNVNGNDSLDGGAGTDSKVTDANERSIVGFP